MRSFALFILLAFLATSCCSKLSVRTEYITEKSFASYYVDTPDPLACQAMGQRLIASWQIPSALWHNQAIQLDVTVRFRNNKELHKIITMDRPIGTYVYEMDAKEYLQSGGILTYKIFLLEDGEVSETWYHPLWQERILLVPNQ